MGCTLTITLTSGDLTTIYGAHEFVTLARAANAQVVGSSSRAVAVATTALVAWTAFQPQQLNTLTWQEAFSFYASTGLPSVGQPLPLCANQSVPAQAGWTYTYAQGGFTGTTGSGSAYQVANASANGLGFGLFQTVTTNNVAGSALLSPASTLFNQTAWFTPGDLFLFLSSCSGAGVGLYAIPSGALQFSAADAAVSPGVSVSFNSQTNGFVRT